MGKDQHALQLIHRPFKLLVMHVLDLAPVLVDSSVSMAGPALFQIKRHLFLVRHRHTSPA